MVKFVGCGYDGWCVVAECAYFITRLSTSALKHCFDAVGWASGRASGLQKLSDGVLVWLSVWSKAQIVCICCSWCHTHARTHARTHTFNGLSPGLPGWAFTRKVEQEAQLSPSDRAMRLVSSNLDNYHATVQLLIWQVLTKPMVWSWRFSWRQCVINKPMTVELWIYHLYTDDLLWRNFLKSTMYELLTWPWSRPFQGIFLIDRVGLPMVSQCTKFEVSRFTRNDAMNGGAKCRKWG